MAECRVLAEQQRYDDTTAAAGWERQLASTRPVCELDRHDDRVLRLLYLCDGGGARLSDAVLSFERSHLRDAAVVCDIRARVLRAAGRFGVRIGRKATLVAALLTMGLSTVLIGLLPTYASIGVWAPVLLSLCRLGQGLGLGGEWGGAVLLAIENAPPGKRAWYGMFPQLGAPIGFICSTGIFILLTHWLTDEEFLSWGWRVPFLASTALVFVGLYVRLRLEETPAFMRALENNERVRIPMLTVVRQHTSTLLLATFASTATFVIFYLMTVFTLSWAVSDLGFEREEFLWVQIGGVLFFGLTIPISAVIADRRGRLPMLIAATIGIILFGLTFQPLFGSGTWGGALAFLALGLGLMGFTYGPLGTALAELFPTAVRYTGASVAFNLAGIVGASLAPYIATALAQKHGIAFVGYYLSAAALVSLAAFVAIKRRDVGAEEALAKHGKLAKV